MPSISADFRKFYGPFMGQIQDCLNLLDVSAVDDIVQSLWDVYSSRNRAWVIGNGGSAATAIHLAACLSQGTMVDGKPCFRAEALVSNISFLTAVANDSGYENVFRRQLENCLSPGDAVIAISCSGNSPNVVSAVEYGRSRGARTIALLGFGGGALRCLAENVLHVPNYNYGVVETVHVAIVHVLGQFLKQKIEAA